MDPLWQAIYFGIGELVFVLTAVLAWINTPAADRGHAVGFLVGMVAAGLAFVNFVPFVIALRAA